MPDSSSSPLHFRALLDRAMAGDETALDDLIQRFYVTVQTKVHKSLAFDLRTSRPWLTARFSTGDVVQEVFRSVVKSLQDFQGEDEEAFTGYLAMIIRNRIMDAVRFHEASRRDIRRVARNTDDHLELERGEDPAKVASEHEEILKVEAAFAELSEQDRLLLRARVEQSLSFETLATDLGYSSASAARRAYYAAQAQIGRAHV